MEPNLVQEVDVSIINSINCENSGGIISIKIANNMFSFMLFYVGIF
jgi:hypothetical protein